MYYTNFKNKKKYTIFLFIFIFFTIIYGNIKVSNAQVKDPKYDNKTLYPEIEIKTAVQNDAIKTIITLLIKHKCLPSNYNPVPVFTDTGVNATQAFRTANNFAPGTTVTSYLWEILDKNAGEKTANGETVVDCGDKSSASSGGSVGGASQTYTNISSFSGVATSTTFTNTNTGGLGDAFNYILTLMAVAIIVLVVFRIIQGAIIKGTFDNIYDDKKGKKIIETAGKALLIFILAYAVLSFINPDLTGWTFIQQATGLASSGSGSAGGDCGSIAGYTKTDIESMLLQDEGNKTTAYYDSLGIPTIGVGYNLIRNNNVKQELVSAGVSEADATKLAGLSKNTSKAGQQISGYTITNDQVKALLEKDLSTFTNTARKVSNNHGINFDSLPANVKNVLIDMSYAGEGTFDKFNNMLNFVKDGNYTKAAGQIKYSDLAETQISPYCSQTGDRCNRLVGLMSAQCKSTIQTNPNQQSLATQNSSSAQTVCTQTIPNIKTSDLVDLNTLGIPCKSKEATCFVTPEFGNIVKQVSLDYKIKFPNNTFSVVNAYRSDKQQTDMCKKYSPCAASCTDSNNTHYGNHELGNAIDVSNDTIGGCSKNGTCNSAQFNWLKSYSTNFSHANNLKNDNVHFSITGH